MNNYSSQSPEKSAMKDKAEVIPAFREAVNMSKEELQDWLENSKESRAVGIKKPGEEESTGRQSGFKILELLGKSEDQWDQEDVQHASKVVSYVKRHEAQKPDKSPDELDHMKWAHSLRNWGHNPMKDEDVQAKLRDS